MYVYIFMCMSNFIAAEWLSKYCFETNLKMFCLESIEGNI